MEEKIRAIEALTWFRENICAKKCNNRGIKRLICYEKMRKIITGFEDYPVTPGQFIYSMRVKNKVCDLTDKEFKKTKNNEKEKNSEEEYLIDPMEEFLESLIFTPDGAEMQDKELEWLEQEEREEFFWPDSEIDDYDEDGVYIGPNQGDLGIDDLIDNLEIEKDEETGIYKLKR